MRVLLVEDHTAFREALMFSFDHEPGFEVVAEAGSVEEARRVSHGDVDLTVLDLDLPDGDGTGLLPELHAANPTMMVLILTASTDRNAHAQTVAAGAAGILHKSCRLRDITDAAKSLVAGESLLSKEEIAELLRVADRRRERNREMLLASESLTPRELDVLQALADGLSDKEIAEQMYVSSGTVRNHVARLLSKLEVHSRLQALVFAVRYGLVDIERR